MTGVEILATQEIYNTIIPMFWSIVGFFLAFVSVILAVIAITECNNVGATIHVTLIICGLVLFILGMSPNKTNIDYIEHKVTISDEVSMNEFYEKYEVIDQEDKIYIVRERE